MDLVKNWGDPSPPSTKENPDQLEKVLRCESLSLATILVKEMSCLVTRTVSESI